MDRKVDVALLNHCTKWHGWDKLPELDPGVYGRAEACIIAGSSVLWSGEIVVIGIRKAARSL